MMFARPHGRAFFVHYGIKGDIFYMIENETPLLQRDDESNFQYHKRLIYGKLEDKTLADYDYAELSKYAYGKEFSTDVARRLMYGSKRTLDLLSQEAAEIEQAGSSEIISDIDRRLMDLRKEQQKFYDQRRELNKMLMHEARSEHLDEILTNAISSLDMTNMYTEPYFAPEVSDTEAVLVFSDWHYGMVTDNIYNTYNTEICKARVKLVVEKAIERIMLHQCNTLHILLLGDFIHGALRASTRVASEELTIDQLMNASEILAQAINELSKYTNRVYVYSTYGNHARVIPEKKESIHADNMERIIPWWLTQRLANNKRIEIYTCMTNEFVLFDVFGHDICAVHGDLDPIASSQKTLTTLMHKVYGRDLEYILIGDKHHRESSEAFGVTSIICGSLCGTDEYANSKRLYSNPSQLLMIFNRDGLDAEYQLIVE